MEDIKVSIVTVCYNSEKTIERTIKSVLNQTYKNIEYIIIDGASTDKTLEIVDRYIDLFNGRLKVISEKDDGIYYAMNKGIKIATGKLIGIINSDDWYENNAVKDIITAYKDCHDNPFSVYYGKTSYISNGKVIKIEQSSHERLEYEMISHPSSFVTAAAYHELEVFNTDYPCVADYDLMLRYYRSGKVSFIQVDSHIANFTIGGMSSTGKAYIDLLKLKMNYGKINRLKGEVEIIKAKLAILMEKQGMKPIRLRKSKNEKSACDRWNKR